MKNPFLQVAVFLILCGGAVIFFVARPGRANEGIRKPVVSGQFYPASPEALKEQIRSFLTQAKSSPRPGIKALVVPHAGYVYSGRIAAEAFNTVRGQSFDSVIVIGFSHRTPFSGIFVDTAQFYETPLGQVSVNRALAEQIRQDHSVLRDSPPGILAEHSVEVQIPFLQETVANLNIVPIYMGAQNMENARILAEAISKAIEGKNVLMVVSTDLSHYHPYETAKHKDEMLISLFQQGDIPKLVSELTQGNIEACGTGPLFTLLLVQEKMGWRKPVLIRYANSGDVTGDHQAVVGYAALAVTDRQTNPTNEPAAIQAANVQANTEELSMEQKKGLLQYVRSYLEAYYANSLTEPALEVDSKVLNERRGVFVTLKKGGMLRGCIGRITANEPVRDNLKQMALAAALSDPRFLPVTEKELKDLDITISILTPLSPVASYHDIRLGTDGIVVEYGGRSGVFLPEVATETGWDQKTFFRHCALDKAGLREGELEKAKIQVFQSEAFSESDYR
ncbi:MAG: AmmeMemoRadiSam system protein B [Candidatus Omnitrophica bacterium]|nr:AmmeMemoRadiSam system protein B [Candidatus Omnitrophota bacterium]